MDPHISNLFKIIKAKEPGKKLVKILSAELQIADGAAYRKANGLSLLTVPEFFILVNKFNVDLMQFSLSRNQFTFEGKLIYNDNKKLLEYFLDTAALLKTISASNGMLHNLSKDVPLFYYFNERELGWFKIYFMMKYILADQSYNGMKFNMENCEHEILDAALKYSQNYQEINTTEVWNLESVNTTLHQIESACQTGMLNDVNLIKTLFRQFKNALKLVNRQVQNGVKYQFNIFNKPLPSTFKLYHNELYLAHNNYYLNIPGVTDYAFLSFGVFNYIRTQNSNFTNFTRFHFNNIQNQSILLNANKIETEKYFEKLFTKIDAVQSKCLQAISVNF